MELEQFLFGPNSGQSGGRFDFQEAFQVKYQQEVVDQVDQRGMIKLYIYILETSCWC